MKFAIDGSMAAKAVLRRKSTLGFPDSQWFYDSAPAGQGAWRCDLMVDGSITNWSGGYPGNVSAYGPLTQATAGSRPVQSSTGFQTQQEGYANEGMTFDGTDDFMTYTGVPACLSVTTADGEVWFVVRQEALVADTTTRTLFSYGGTTAGSYRAIERRVVDGVNRLVISDGLTDLFDEWVDFSGVHFIRAWWEAGNFGYDLNGSPGASATFIGSTGTTITCLGINTAQNGGTWKGVVAQIMMSPVIRTAVDVASNLSSPARYYYRQ